MGSDSAVPTASVCFKSLVQEELSNAVDEAISDYIHLRGLKGLCPDVHQWGPPPSPAAFLDSGLPKTSVSGVVSLALPAECEGAIPRFSTRCNSRWSRGWDRGSSVRAFPPSWKEHGPEGSLGQVLCCNEDAELGNGNGEWETSTARSGEGKSSLSESLSSPELGQWDSSAGGKLSAATTSIDAKQVHQPCGVRKKLAIITISGNFKGRALVRMNVAQYK